MLTARSMHQASYQRLRLQNTATLLPGLAEYIYELDNMHKASYQKECNIQMVICTLAKNTKLYLDILDIMHKSMTSPRSPSGIRAQSSWLVMRSTRFRPVLDRAHRWP